LLAKAGTVTSRLAQTPRWSSWFTCFESTIVSFERVLSGSGLYEVYRFLRQSDRGQEPEWLTKDLTRELPAMVIARTARRSAAISAAMP
jgi:glucokinase